MKLLSKKILDWSFHMCRGDVLIGNLDLPNETKTFEYTSDHEQTVNTMIIVELDKTDRKKLKSKSKIGIFVGYLK